MIRLTTLAFVLVFAMPAAAAPADSAATTTQQAQQPAPAKVKKVCKSDISTGSIMPKRTCKTAEEWAADAAANRKGLEDAIERQTTDSMISR